MLGIKIYRFCKYPDLKINIVKLSTVEKKISELENRQLNNIERTTLILFRKQTRRLMMGDSI